MTITETILLILFGVSIIELIIFAIYWVDYDGRQGLVFLNPVANYKKWCSMNWFGVIFWTLLLNVFCPVYSLCYWFWKLCTVGRK